MPAVNKDFLLRNRNKSDDKPLMKVSNSLLYRGLALALAVLTACFFAGCQLAEVEQQRLEPVFFPPLPERPRLQFLKSFSGPDELGAVTTSGFERFVLGEPNAKQGIAKPYGMAIFDGKLYVCDVGKRIVEVFDLKKRTSGHLTQDRRLINPASIYIDHDGTKYVADPTAGAVFVFDKEDNLKSMLGKELKINPRDVVVRGQNCYVTDLKGNQVVVFDKTSGREIVRIGKKSDPAGKAEPLQELGPGEFSLISDLALDREGNIYVTDRAGGRITEFDRSGKFKRTIGRLGRNIDEFIRPKGIAIDKENRIWVVDAGPEVEVAKIYNQQAQLLLFFGRPGNRPGMMNLPAKIVLDYDNVELFEQYAAEGANIEFLVLVSNQYGPNKISVYGFGAFPVQERARWEAKKFALKPGSENELVPTAREPLAEAEPERAGTQPDEQKEDISELHQRSLALYRGGQLEKAREGFARVLNSDLIPAPMAKTIQGYLAEIDNRLDNSERKREIAELYYRSITFYRAGQL